MKYRLLTILVMAWFPALNAQYLHHDIHASIEHSTGGIIVTDTLVVPEGLTNTPFVFSLNSNLSVIKTGEGITVDLIDASQDAKIQTYRITFAKMPKGELKIPLHYKGTLEGRIETGAAEYARGFSDTDGMIGPGGIYLAGSTSWIPAFEEAALFTFTLTAEVDEDWSIVSQGTRTENSITGGRRTIRYESSDPMDEVFLIAGRWTEYSTRAGEILVQAFLRTPDEALANRYLQVTSHYLDLYNTLIGKYPYTKFALVENFWETGYGMPSFTLLGPKVIRFPWILHSSYPHELLHNYWGNSVFVDYEKGNWCEGITAYMADHLIKEQQGLAVEYRRNTLQKFTDYVNEENDFPPSGFISRNNPAEEAVGYGKVLMFNNMLRDELGDDLFIRAYADFYRNNKFSYASYDDIRISFEKVSGKDLKPFFDQWIGRKGAPSLELSEVKVNREGSTFELCFSIGQVQEGEPFHLNVPVAIYLENEEEVFLTRIKMDKHEINNSYKFDTRPLKVSIDPQFNLMRTLHRSEVPSTLSQLFGGQQSVVILPEKCNFSEEYLKIARFWKQTQAAQGKELRILYDSQVDQLPADKPVWVFGFENLFYNSVEIGEQYSEQLSAQEMQKIGTLTEESSLVYALPNSQAVEQTIGFLGTRQPEALEGLSRKLFHYGSYGYLGFEGDAPDNVLKGVFPVLNSRLDHVIPYADHPAIENKLPARKALAGK